MWDLPRPGLEPVSPALAGRFSTTEPPGKPPFLLYQGYSQLSVFISIFCSFLSCIPSWAWPFDNTHLFICFRKMHFPEVLLCIWLCPDFHFFTVKNSKMTWSFSFKVSVTSVSQWLENFWHLVSAGSAGMPGSLFPFVLSAWASLQCGSLRILRKA